MDKRRCSVYLKSLIEFKFSTSFVKKERAEQLTHFVVEFFISKLDTIDEL